MLLINRKYDFIDIYGNVRKFMSETFLDFVNILIHTFLKVSPCLTLIEFLGMPF